MTRHINSLIIHCAATPNGRVHDVYDIDRWHRQAGFRRTQAWRARQNDGLGHIGYHFVIYLNGAVATGRHLDEIGAHARGFNAKSIGACLIGTDRFSLNQWHSLRAGVLALRDLYPALRILGHRDLPNVNKTCPGFDVASWLENDMQPLTNHIFQQPAK